MKNSAFNCLTCEQTILVTNEWAGQHMNCPSRNTRIAITAPTQPFDYFEGGTGLMNQDTFELLESS